LSGAALAAPPALGSLTDRVQLLHRDVAGGDDGGTITTYVPLATVWARVRELTTRQGESADGRAVLFTHSVVLRYRSDLLPGDRLVYAGRNLELVAASDLNDRRAYLSCTCSETGITG
jgi:SPP1 family predicted phage head-tail adaptor